LLSFGQALEEQATHPEIDTDLVKGVAAVLFASGTVLVLSSMWVRERTAWVVFVLCKNQVLLTFGLRRWGSREPTLAIILAL